MLQLVALLAMDPPSANNPEAMRDARATLLKSVCTLKPVNVVRGQYRGYRDEPGVARDSQVETYAAVRLEIDSWRWADVPFYIRVGKCLPVTICEVFVQLARPPQVVFREDMPSSDYYRFRLSPNVIIALGARTKNPGEVMKGQFVELLAHEDHGDEMQPYERLLGDAAKGEPTHFAREDAVEQQWRIIDPVLGNMTPAHEYEPGTWGPPEANTLITSHEPWHNPS
jgi:glucose-6-phosphate 1-dehydrogenase